MGLFQKRIGRDGKERWSESEELIGWMLGVEMHMTVRSPEGASTIEDSISKENLISWAEEHGHDTSDLPKCGALFAASVGELLMRASKSEPATMSPEIRAMVNQMPEDSKNSNRSR